MGRDHASDAGSGRLHVWRSDDPKALGRQQPSDHSAPTRERASFTDADSRAGLSGTEIGTVKWYSGERGYGFITPDDGGADIFVHASAVERAGFPTLEAGQRLRFRLRRRGGQELTAVRLSAGPSS